MDKCKLCGKPKDQHYSTSGLYCKPAADNPSPDAPTFQPAEPPADVQHPFCAQCGQRGVEASHLKHLYVCHDCCRAWPQSGDWYHPEAQPPVECDPLSRAFDIPKAHRTARANEILEKYGMVVLPAAQWADVVALPKKWIAEQAEYLTAEVHAAAAVRLCARELRKVIGGEA